MDGAAFKSGAKDENLNDGVPSKDHSARIGKTIWWLKLGTHLYTPVYLREGCFTLAPLAITDISMPFRRKVAG
ncbi:hypothetical protein [Campylobacter concisus]|uniref:hypothetical protein n=1 Tax=Campylobacter concisus TaxID=199 RepID=UPI001901E378|nr:hypothetical protein [Campylobacter concisus]